MNNNYIYANFTGPEVVLDYLIAKPCSICCLASWLVWELRLRGWAGFSVS